MDKIGIMTFHRAINYGAMLQAVALQRYISSVGYDSELIDYVDQLYDHYRISYKSGNIVKSAIKYLLSGHVRNKNQKFQQFLNENAKVSQDSYTRENISSLPEKEYKCFFTGSDQVFNPRIVNYDDTYLLSFVKDKKKCNSYAASIGLTEMLPEEVAWLKKYISKYAHLLIREDSAKRLLEANGIANSLLVCDPTFLVSSDEWQEMEHKLNMPEKYILYYGFKKNNAMEKCVKELVEKTNLPVYVISDAIRFSDKTKQQIKGVGPAEWLWLIHHAEYVVTNSFHGMIFSFIYRRQVWIGDPNDGTFSRMEDFLAQMGCSDRILTEDKEVEMASVIDYGTVNVKLVNYISESQDILKAILAGSGDE